MTAAVLLAITAIGLRQIRRARRTLAGLVATTEPGCDTSWCACDCGDDPAPCASSISFGGAKTCTLGRGHSSLHEHGGWRWTDGIADEAAA